MRYARRSPRHPLHDYRQPGLYFVTACTRARRPLFGDVRAGEMRRSAFGEIAHAEWLRTLEMRSYLIPDVFIVMPDHVHLLFGLMHEGRQPDGDLSGDLHPRRRDTMHGVPTAHDGGSAHDGRRFATHTARSVSSIVGAYKAAVTRHIRQLDPTVRVWQPRFHDRVVRSAAEAARIRTYVDRNAASWRPSP